MLQPIFINLIWQIRQNWRIDWLSLLLGLGLGFLLGTATYFLLWPLLEGYWDKLTNRWQKSYDWWQASLEERFRQEMGNYAQHYHDFSRDYLLSDFFVPPFLWAPNWEVGEEVGSDFILQQLHLLWPEWAARTAVPALPMLPVSHLLQYGQRVLIAGEAGVGKSSLLAHCIASCTAAQKDSPLASLLPILIHVAELEPEEAGQPWPTGVNGLAAALQARLDSVRFAGITDLLTQKLTEGTVLLCLDGADELPASQQAGCVQWVRQLLQSYPHIRLFIAAPAHGYAPFLSLGFVVTAIAPWHGRQAEQLATSLAKTTQSNPIIWRRFWQPGQLAWQTTLRWQLANNQVSAEGEMPARAIEQLEATFSLHLPHNKKDPTWLAPATRDLWQTMAYATLQEGHFWLSEAWLSQTITPILFQYNVIERGAESKLIQAIEQSRLFYRVGKTGWRFRQPMWRDFLAASYLAQMPASAPLIQAKLAHPYWANITRFYISRMGAGQMANYLLAQPEPNPLYDNLFQVATWLAEAVDPGEWRRQVLTRLGKLTLQPNIPVILRQKAVIAIAQTHETGVLTLLRQLLPRADSLLRPAIVAAIPVLGVELVLDWLSQLLNDHNEAVQQGATAALAWLYHPAADKLLMRALSAEQQNLYSPAAEGLILNGTAPLDLLRELIGVDDPHLRRALIYPLSLIQESWATNLLQTLAKDESWLVHSVAETMLDQLSGGESGAPAWQVMPIGDQPWLIVWATQQGRGVPGGLSALPFVIELINQKQPIEIKLTAIQALAKGGYLEAVPALLTLSQDNDEQLRQAAFLALCTISHLHGRWI